MTLVELEEAYSSSYLKWVAIARRQLAKTPALKSETAEDVVQAVLLRLMGGAYVDAPSGQEFESYMAGSIMNRIFDLVKRSVERHNPALAEIDYLTKKVSGCPSPAESAEFSELQDTIKRTIETFASEESRTFLSLIYLQGWSFTEASEKLGLKNMNSTCHRFRERLAEELAGRLEDLVRCRLQQVCDEDTKHKKCRCHIWGRRVDWQAMTGPTTSTPPSTEKRTSTKRGSGISGGSSRGR